MMIYTPFGLKSERKATMIFTFLCYICLCSLMLAFVIGLGGCQIDVGANLGTKMFYPDKLGTKDVGDPRKGMNEERSVSTSVEYKPFPGVSKGGEQ